MKEQNKPVAFFFFLNVTIEKSTTEGIRYAVFPRDFWPLKV